MDLQSLPATHNSRDDASPQSMDRGSCLHNIKILLRSTFSRGPETLHASIFRMQRLDSSCSNSLCWRFVGADVYWHMCCLLTEGLSEPQTKDKWQIFCIQRSTRVRHIRWIQVYSRTSIAVGILSLIRLLSHGFPKLQHGRIPQTVSCKWWWCGQGRNCGTDSRSVSRLSFSLYISFIGGWTVKLFTWTASTPLICFRCGPGLRVPEASDINPSLHNALGQMTAARQEYHWLSPMIIILSYP